MANKIDCVPVLKALGDENRLRMMRLLIAQPLGVNELAERLKITQYNTSKHLRVLREANLVNVSKQGKRREYSVSADFLQQLERNHQVLDLGCCTFRFDRLA